MLYFLSLSQLTFRCLGEYSKPMLLMNNLTVSDVLKTSTQQAATVADVRKTVLPS